ncbi:MAG: hypothetical protein HKN23_04515 [Verrucomicrobiales bacterium]|nr:hypothetical protein [Verrucomicrobiales bacterium]
MWRPLVCLSIFLGLAGSARSQVEPRKPASPPDQSLQSGSEEITPSHVFQQVTLLRAELELIRLEMGKPGVAPPLIRVEKAAPREVYFQALTLFRKTDRLAFEHTRERSGEPVPPEEQIRPIHVRALVDAALKRVQRVKESLAISETVKKPALETGIEPSGVFNDIVAANREINQLLEQQFAPGDVYQQTTVAIAYLSRLLDSLGGISTPPQPPAFERRKRPADVYRKLISCFGQIREIGNLSGIGMLDLEVDESRVESAEPSDVYDVASLLVSELAHLHGHRADAKPPRKVYNPGRKLPSHVYQRLGILHSQIEELHKIARNNPDWLED